MKKIGVLFGMENSFPGALVERINAVHPAEIVAEFVRVGAVLSGAHSDYAVLIDRISHEVPFYRAWLKQAALNGAVVLNDPFRASADDKFLNGALAARMGVAVPPTVLLPHKQHPGQLTAYSLRNLEYPLDWESVFSSVGEHGYLKPILGGGGRDVCEVHNREEFFSAYDASRDQCMIYQKAVNYTAYFRCYVVGRKQVRVMAYDPQRPHEERYLADSQSKVSKKLLQRIEHDAVRLSTALGYELNSVEFAVEQGVPYAIDFMNPVPDADLQSVGADNHAWFVNAVAELAIAKAGATESSTMPWFALPTEERKAKASRKKKAAKKSPASKAAKEKKRPSTRSSER